MFNVYSSLARVEPEQQSLGETTVEVKSNPAIDTAIWLGRIAGTVGGAYHGYKRNNDSIGWGIGWALLGNIFWPVTIPVSLAQGFGKPAKKDE